MMKSLAKALDLVRIYLALIADSRKIKIQDSKISNQNWVAISISKISFEE